MNNLSPSINLTQTMQDHFNEFGFSLILPENIEDKVFREISSNLELLFNHENLNVTLVERKEGSTIFEIAFEVMQIETAIVGGITTAGLYVLNKIAGQEIISFYKNKIKPLLTNKNPKTELEGTDNNFQQMVQLVKDEEIPIVLENSHSLRSFGELKSYLYKLSEEYGELEAKFNIKDPLNNGEYHIIYKSTEDTDDMMIDVLNISIKNYRKKKYKQ